MPKTLLFAFAVVFTAFAVGAGSAHAKGGGGEAEEIREKLQAQIAERRAENAENCANASLWEMMFGHEEAVAETESSATETQ
ncbi:MAG: hypothetical protein AAF557_21805 [Pseudomonadota bacterium]